MHDKKLLLNRIVELEKLLEMSERKTDILTNLLKEASAEFEQALDAISVSEANFRAVFENAPEAIYILDADSRKIIDCNPYTASWLGYARAELLGRQVEDILESGAAGIEENIQAAKDYGTVHNVERRFLKKDGAVTAAEVTGTFLKYEGKPCFVALVRDVAERRQVEELKRYKELFENVSDPVFINDPKGRFIEVNDVACLRFGYAREEILRRRVKDLRKPGQGRITYALKEKLQQGRPIQFEMEMVTKTGEFIPFEFHAQLIDLHGRRAVLSVGRDLSFRKQMENALVKSERLKALGEMSGGVVHNFNNLLQMIMGAGEAARNKLETGQPAACMEAVNSIIQSARRGADVVRRIRDFTLVKSDEPGPAKVFDLGELIDETVRLTRPLWKRFPEKEKDRVGYIRHPGCIVKGNPSEINEVLINLIKNGLEAMPNGGPLIISTSIEQGKIFMKVADKGRGIPAENQEKIFEPFFTTKGMRSSGLGLSSSYGIIKKHEGIMRVESEPGAGATFTVILPLAEKLEYPASVTSVAACDRPINFLLIDDEESILTAMKMYFEDSQICLMTAHSAKKGLEIIRDGEIDVILCDLSMDDMNGWEVGKQVKTHCLRNGSPKIPFLLYTGLIRRLDARQLEESGVDRVVSKPVSYEDLEHIVQDMVHDMRKAN